MCMIPEKKNHKHKFCHKVEIRKVNRIGKEIALTQRK